MIWLLIAFTNHQNVFYYILNCHIFQQTSAPIYFVFSEGKATTAWLYIRTDSHIISSKMILCGYSLFCLVVSILLPFHWWTCQNNSNFKISFLLIFTQIFVILYYNENLWKCRLFNHDFFPSNYSLNMLQYDLNNQCCIEIWILGSSLVCLIQYQFSICILLDHSMPFIKSWQFSPMKCYFHLVSNAGFPSPHCYYFSVFWICLVPSFYTL